LLVLLSKAIETKTGISKTGLDSASPLVRFFRPGGDTLLNYLALDDALMWSSISSMAQAKDRQISELARRVLNRSLYKCLDVSLLARSKGGDSAARFEHALKGRLKKL